MPCAVVALRAGGGTCDMVVSFDEVGWRAVRRGDVELVVLWRDVCRQLVVVWCALVACESRDV